MEEERGETPARALAARVESLLDDLGASGDRERELAAELVRVLASFYGAALSRLVERMTDAEIEAASADELVAAVLALHDLHPVDVVDRVSQALDSVRPAPVGLQVLGIDDDGVLRLRLGAGSHGCQAASMRRAIEDAVLNAVPELTGVTVEDELPLLQIGTR